MEKCLEFYYLAWDYGIGYSSISCSSFKNNKMRVSCIWAWVTNATPLVNCVLVVRAPKHDIVLFWNSKFGDPYILFFSLLIIAQHINILAVEKTLYKVHNSVCYSFDNCKLVAIHIICCGNHLHYEDASSRFGLYIVLCTSDHSKNERDPCSK